ncbi:MAG: hypothetical protein H6751_14120 [Candidatus Omnitrophica bacterium]|nr:hypothetical protein [Candidatus Omnitrophota bacterium]
MNQHLPKFVNRKQATFLLPEDCDDYAVIQNPSYVHPPFELCPLTPKKMTLEKGPRAMVMDMDGTTTTTEALCLHSLETMVRRITGRLSEEEWEGLNSETDYPHIIGNSTTKHVEYLVRTYQGAIDPVSMRTWAVRQSAWTLVNGQDENRTNEVMGNLRALGAGGLLEDAGFRDSILGAEDLEDLPSKFFSDLGERYLIGCDLNDFTNQVRLSVDIYYHRYHEILRELQLGEGALLSREILGSSDHRLIEPMPGVGVFLALIKGWLGKEAADLADLVQGHLASEVSEGKERLIELGRRFEKTPAKVAVVTSSIRYEADIVLNEVFGVLRKEIHGWPISEERKEKILLHFSSPEQYYDAIITASDSSEIRLKPHRDLYSLALHRLGVPVEQFDQVIGFEDSESGVIAIRAAGIPLCVAVPFAETGGHSFDAASHVCQGGLPEVLLEHGLFLDREVNP